MPEIKLVNVSKYNCLDLNLTINDGEYFVIVGETGAGKTTLLNMIAGVLEYSGTVLIDGLNINHLPPFKRGVGYLLQELALFPHYSVEANISFGLRAQGYAKSMIKERVSSLMKMMNIDHLAGHYPHMISGGEKKRVALARSLAPSPRILLLDEPTSNLDAQTAKYLRRELHFLLKNLGVTTVHVTHNLREAEEIADRIALISNGLIEQVATPVELFFNPANSSVAEFLGMPNIMECNQSRSLSSGLVEIVMGDLKIILPYDGRAIKKIAIPPDAVHIYDEHPVQPLLNSFIGTVEDIIQNNSVVILILLIGKIRLIAELPTSIFDSMSIERGGKVFGAIKIERLRYIGS
ncbi:MAG: ABC transporter ATP-binding protein [Deltaproteobacteria bacterium]|nr:ABC transporter ATP-binding protein [Deltaproteobacteria bacterium]